MQRGGNGVGGDGVWPETDGQGCPMCGAVRGGGHGGGCELWKFRYDERGDVIGRHHPENPVVSWDTPLEYIEAGLRDMRNP